MPNENYFQLYVDMQKFLDFDDTDVENLKKLKPVFEKHGPGITDAFYGSLTDYPATAAIIEGRVDSLKATHLRWMIALFDGDYGKSFYDVQFHIGQVHVKHGIEPAFVESVTSVMRQRGLDAILEEEPDRKTAKASFDSLVKVLDLALLTINLAYADERLDRMSDVTGMSRRLIENLIRSAKKS